MHGTSDLYLDLMQRVLVNSIYEDDPFPAWWYTERHYDGERRRDGRDWPSRAHTMVGTRRLDNVRMCVEQILRDGVPGDLIETGVWRGGVCIYMRAILEAHAVRNRTVWVADSFQGVPLVDREAHELDVELGLHHHNDVLAVTADDVRANFERYGLLDDQVAFLSGWFAETLPSAPIERLALLRLDGDLYSSTTEALTALYPRLSPGGFVIVDDWDIPACRQAVEDFRALHELTEPIEPIDDNGVYWRSEGAPSARSGWSRWLARR